MRIVILAVYFVSILEAENIQQLITQAIKKHPSLHTIEHRLSSMDERIKASQNFSSPDISFTLNNIQFNDPLDRSLEPMQYEAINFKQKFPWFGKLQARKTYTLAKKDVMLDSYDVAKVKLVEEIRMTAYTVKELQERIRILNTYQSVANQNIKLYTSYASTQTKSHTSSMSASLLLSKIKIRAHKYNTILKSQKSKLHYLTQTKVDFINDALTVTSPKPLATYLAKLENNPTYRMKDSEHDLASANKTIHDLSSTPDPYVKMGYFHRASFEDYTSITVGVSYPLYDTEKLNSEAARKELLAAQSAVLDYKSSLESQIEIMYAKLTEAYAIYKIIKNESLPQLEHMFELSQSNIQRGGDLFTYTNLLDQKLALEEELTSIKAEYLRTKARLTSLTGAI